MSNHESKPMNSPNVEAHLNNSVSDPLPKDSDANFTPWEAASLCVLLGIAFTAITIEIFYLNYILPIIGTLLTLIGFRILRHENKWMNRCFILAVLRAVCFFPPLILNTTVLRSESYITQAVVLLSVLNVFLQFLLHFCFWQALKTAQQKVELPPHAGSAAALVVWYGLVCLLGSIRYHGQVFAFALVIGYIFIIRSLRKSLRELTEAGYDIRPRSVKFSNRAVVLGILMVLILGCSCGYLFGNSYPMDWSAVDSAEHNAVEDVKVHLVELGFPEYVLSDLAAEDIAACAGALQVVVDVQDHPVNDGRRVNTVNLVDPKSGAVEKEIYEQVYDEKELRITGVGVQLPGERESWMIFHHFLWTSNPGFYGTDSIQLLPTHQRLSEGWSSTGDVTGRLLYNKDNTTYTAPYYSMGYHTYTSNSIFRGTKTSSDFFAAFSLPRAGEQQRGYLAYSVDARLDGLSVYSQINYTHQQNWKQYPVMTAMERRTGTIRNHDGAFKTIQDSFIFYLTEDGVEQPYAETPSEAVRSATDEELLIDEYINFLANAENSEAAKKHLTFLFGSPGMGTLPPESSITDLNTAEHYAAFAVQQHALVVAQFGNSAWDNVSYDLVEIEPAEGALGYRVVSTGELIDQEEYEKILYEYWEDVSVQEGVTYADIFLTEGESTENIANKRVDILAKYGKDVPVELVTASNSHAYEVFLSFNDQKTSLDGFENFHFVIDNSDRKWKVLQGLSWIEPYPESPNGD